MNRIFGLAAGCIALACGPASAQVAGGSVTITGAWARATAPQQTAGAAYLTLTSPGGDRLTGVSSDAASMAMLHRSTSQGGMAGMDDVAVLDLPAGRPVTLAPRGMHVMLMDLRHPLVAGGRLGLTLTLARAGAVQVAVPVLPIGASGPPP